TAAKASPTAAKASPTAAKASPTAAKTSTTVVKASPTAATPTGPSSKANTDKSPPSNQSTATAAASIQLTPSEENKLLTLLNQGSDKELLEIDGIAATRAKAIAKARPFQNLHEIILVPGVGNTTFRNILAYGKKMKDPASPPTKS
ncbi:MAG TPA: helix-hairpin-helix domain-containing protein, partial [Verrucomicrobiales bacterium]|nr:helix-hairpin-helix domain-containing protein [Verrucomicrobiales bacterium]